MPGNALQLGHALPRRASCPVRPPGRPP